MEVYRMRAWARALVARSWITRQLRLFGGPGSSRALCPKSRFQLLSRLLEHRTDNGEFRKQYMKMRSPIPHKKARIEIIPLIDIMFFLLASFMMVSLSQTRMKGIRVNLPAANYVPPPETKKDYVSVRVSEGNVIYFDNVLVNSDQVLPRLSELHRSNPDLKVSIS